jgi:hypothetical protein
VALWVILLILCCCSAYPDLVCSVVVAPAPSSCFCLETPCCAVCSCFCCSQQIRFGLQSPQEIINCGVFHVYERALYKVSWGHLSSS